MDDREPRSVILVAVQRSGNELETWAASSSAMLPALYLSDGYLLGMGGWLWAGVASLLGCLKLRRRWKTQPAKLRAVHAVLSVWFVLATLTVPELYCALFYDETDSFSVTNVSQRWYRMHVKPNEAGFRDDRPIPGSVPEDGRHIGFVGDSFTFGHGVARIEDRFSDRIAAALESEQPGRFVVSNIALPGLDIRQLVDRLLPDLLEKQGAEFDVLIYVFVPNDIEYLDKRTGDYYRNIAQRQPQCFLFRDTYFYNLLYYRVQQLYESEREGYYDYLRESYTGAPWRRLRRKLDELRALCRRHHVELRLVVFPFLHNLGKDYPFSEAHRLVSEYCRKNNVPVLDLEPVFREHVDEPLTVNRYDAHPNERAHAIAAEAIRAHLLDDLFAEESSRIGLTRQE